MKSLELMQLSPEKHWDTVATYTTKEDMCWAIEFASMYPDEFRVKVGR